MCMVLGYRALILCAAACAAGHACSLSVCVGERKACGVCSSPCPSTLVHKEATSGETLGAYLHLTKQKAELVFQLVGHLEVDGVCEISA